jgi:monoamine oxidase
MSKEILIVGAGASGLIAGKLLAEKGYLVTIIESRDRIGGRIFSDSKTFSFPVEYGAEFIHGDLPFTMSLARESNSNVTVSGGKWYQMRQGKIEQSELFDDQWEEMLRVLNELKTDTNIEAFLQENFYDQKYADFRKGVKSFVEGYDAADTHKVSAFALREEWSESDDAKQYRIDGGYERILNFIADEIRKTRRWNFTFIRGHKNRLVKRKGEHFSKGWSRYSW